MHFMWCSFIMLILSLRLSTKPSICAYSLCLSKKTLQAQICQWANSIKLSGVKLKYSGRTRSIPWLLMPWLLLLPGHQQPLYWLCRKNEPLSTVKKGLNFLYPPIWRNERKCRYVLCFPMTKVDHELLVAEVFSCPQINVTGPYW